MTAARERLAPRRGLPMSTREKLELTVREYRPGDEVAILEAFNDVFGRTDPNFRPRTLATWRWQYLENPHGWRIWLGFDAEGRVIGQQASLPMRMRVGDETMLWSQVVDSFSHPRYGGGLKKNGVYARTARAHSDNYGGAPPERDPIMYGFPVRPAWRIGKLFLDYEVCRSQDALYLETERFRGAAAPGVEVEEVEAFPEEVMDLFERARPTRGAATVRDAAYLNWRFVERPEVAYRRALARRGRELVGLAIHRPGVFDGHPGGLICDWLVPADDPHAAAALQAWLVERTRADGHDVLMGIWPETCPEWRALQEHGYRAATTSYTNVICQYTRRFDIRWLYWNWSYTLGDFDLC